MTEIRSTICWNCANTNADKCAFFDPKKHTPVEGWDAIPRYVNGELWSYLVLDCPNFTPEPPRGNEEIGVYYDDALGAWCATVCYERKRVLVGVFDTLREAFIARAIAANEVYKGLPPTFSGERYDGY